jgi:hypothetical protein
MWQLLSWFCGISCLVWGYSDPRFRDTEGFPLGTIGLPMAMGVALLVVGWGTGRRWRNFSLWLALALVGQAVTLQMIDAGPALRYQHYQSLARLLDGPFPLLLLYLVGQTILVVAGFSARWSGMQAWIGRTFKGWQLLGMGLVVFLSSATVSKEVLAYMAELSLASLVQFVSIGNIVLMVWALPSETLAALKERLEKVFGGAGEQDQGQPVAVDRLAILAAVWVAALAAALSLVIYERHPHVPDEVMYLFQARYLASGRLTVPAPPAPEAFGLYMIPYKADMWYSIFPPGWPAMLAVGVLLGIPWLINPLLAGLNVLLTYALLVHLYSRRTARLAALLLCTSPWHVFMAMNFMSHTFLLTCILVAAVAVAYARRSGKAMWMWLSGGALGMASLIRPLDALVMAAILGLCLMVTGRPRVKTAALVALVLGALLVGAAVLPYNEVLTGDPLVFPLSAYYEEYYGPKTNALGFGPERGLGWAIDPFPGHSPIDALINANLNAFSVNIELFGWSTGSLLMIALFVLAGAKRRSDYLMLGVIAAICGIYSLYWFSGGPDFGARYWYLILVPCIVLTVRGLQCLERRCESGPAGSAEHGTRVLVAVLCLCMLALMNYFPWRAIDKYHHYLHMRPDIRFLSDDYRFGKSVVLIRGDSHPDYASAWVFNPLDPSADAPVYAWDRSPRVRTEVLQAYPERPIWLVDGPSITHNGYKVISGPLPAHEMTTSEN